MAYRKRPLKVEAKQFRTAHGYLPLEQWCDNHQVPGRAISESEFVVQTTKHGYLPVKNGDWVVRDELGNITVHEDYEMNLLFADDSFDDA